MAAEHGRAVIASAKHALCGVVECCQAVSGPLSRRFERRIYYIIGVFRGKLFTDVSKMVSLKVMFLFAIVAVF